MMMPFSIFVISVLVVFGVRFFVFDLHQQEKNVRWVKQPCARMQRIRQERPGRLVRPDTGCIGLWTPGAFR